LKSLLLMSLRQNLLEERFAFRLGMLILSGA